MYNAPHPEYPTQEALQEAIANCRRCERLVAWREAVAQNPPKRHMGEDYWAKGVPSFGDPNARLLIVGLAPAAQGANRTGRMFTGDRSGDWVFRALHKAGFANQPTSVHIEDNLALTGAYITAPCHCAPPDNKPLPEEFANCRGFLSAELALMPQVKVVVAFGKIGWDSLLKEPLITGGKVSPKPAFGHGAEAKLPSGKVLLGSYHPSQQNTFTGKLTEPMFDAVFTRAREILAEEP